MRNRVVTACMAVILLTGAGIRAAAQGNAANERVTVEAVLGKVDVRSSGEAKWRPARMGMPLRMGWDVRTYVESNVELRFETGSVLKIAENSVVTLSKLMMDKPGGSSASNVKVGTGSVWANVKKLTNAKSTFEFETPTAVASIRGTTLDLTVGQKGDRINVYEGLVSVRRRGGTHEVSVPGGRGAFLSHDDQEIRMLEIAGESSGDSTTQDSSGAAADTGAVVDSLAVADSAVSADSTAGGEERAADTTAFDPGSDSAGVFVLRVLSPEPGTVVREPSVVIKGVAAPGAAVTIAGQEAGVGPDGSFSGQTDLTEGMNDIQIEAAVGSRRRTASVKVEYRQKLFLSVTNIVDNMEVTSEELTLDIDVTEGAQFSVNGREGDLGVMLKPGANVITVKAWDGWGGTAERVYTVRLREAESFELNVVSPPDGMIVKSPEILVTGSTLPGAKVKVMSTSITDNSSGFFSMKIPLPDEPGEYTVEIEAVLGDNQISVERTVVYEPVRIPLDLAISMPVDGQKISTRSLRVAGKAPGASSVKVNGKIVMVSAQGLFSSEIIITEKDIGDFDVEVIAANDEQELTKDIMVVVDGASPAINTSIPQLVVAEQGLPATSTDRLRITVTDRTPADEITVMVENNNSREEYLLESGENEFVPLDAGLNVYSIRAFDLAKNMSAMVKGQIFYLPRRQLKINIIEPSNSNLVIDDLPPMPSGVRLPELDVEVEVDDDIGNIPETIRYCRISGNGQTAQLKNNGDYSFSGRILVRRGINAFTIETEDMSGNRGTRTMTITINEL